MQLYTEWKTNKLTNCEQQKHTTLFFVITNFERIWEFEECLEVKT